MSKSITSISFASFALVFASIAGPASISAKEFTYSEKVNAEMARKMKMPVFFAVPASARSSVPADVKTTDKLIDFKHPDAKDLAGDVGLRLYITQRSGMAKRLAQSGLFQTGDILLTFRPEWGGAGAYPNIQMGISHTGIAYIKDGILHNIDNPLNAEYLGANMRGDLTSEHYRTLSYIHVIRPRNLTDSDRANIGAWASRLTAGAKKVYPSQLSFNQDYNAPKYKDGKPVAFVQTLGQIGLGQNPSTPIDLYCSEFVWSLLALKSCDPAKSAEDFKGRRVPSCVKEPMEPMKATGNYMTSRSRTSYSGLADGPLMVVDALKLPKEQRDKMLETVFDENKSGLAKLSPGHKKLAEDMQPKFEPLEQYYRGIGNGVWQGIKARVIGARFRSAIPENYSPTSYLINTLLPPDNKNRTMDYVATIVIE